jgi:hypothetical protein
VCCCVLLAAVLLSGRVSVDASDDDVDDQGGEVTAASRKSPMCFESRALPARA